MKSKTDELCDWLMGGTNLRQWENEDDHVTNTAVQMHEGKPCYVIYKCVYGSVADIMLFWNCEAYASLDDLLANKPIGGTYKLEPISEETAAFNAGFRSGMGW